MKRLCSNEIKLVPGSFVRVCVLGKARAGEMELGLEIALWKIRNLSCRGVNPAYELNEQTHAIGSGELANWIRERVKQSVANVPGGLGKYLIEASLMKKIKPTKTGSVVL